MTKPVKYYSPYRSYSATFKKGELRKRIQFENHELITDDPDIIKWINEGIERCAQKNILSPILTIDEKERLKAQEAEYVVMDGKPQKTSDILAKLDKVAELEAKIKEYEKKGKEK